MKNHIRDIYIILIIVMIGILVRFPITNISDINMEILNDPDSFLYARSVLDLLNKPITEWNLFINRAEDPLMNSTYLSNTDLIPNLLPICIAAICKVFIGLSPNVLIYFASIVICPLSSIPAYLFVKKHTNEIGGIVSGLAMAVSPAYFLHTMHGYFDTDAIIMVLAVSLVIIHLENTLTKDNIKKQVLLCFLSLLLIVSFSLVWQVYYFYVAIAIVLSLIILITGKLLNLQLDYKIPLLSDALMALSCFAVSGKTIISAIKELFISFYSNKLSWPDPAKYIGELEKPAFINGGVNNSFLVHVAGLVNWLGGLPLFIATIVVIIFSIVLFVREKKQLNIVKNDSEYLLIIVALIAWSLIAAILVPSGIRFVQLLALPVNLILGMGFGLAINLCEKSYCVSWKKNLLILFVSIIVFGSFMLCGILFSLVLSILILIVGILLKKIPTNYILSMMIVAIFACPIVNEYNISKNSISFIPDDMVSAMEYISNNADKDSSIVTWWGYGYYIQYATGLRAVSDGGIYNGTYFYWLANVFTTNDENLSYGICQLLNSGSIEAEKVAEEYFKDPDTATAVLKEILVLNRDDAKSVLLGKYKLSNTQVDKLLQYSHAKQDNDIYLVMYNEMRDISSALAYYGLWDFESQKEFTTKFDNKINDYIYPEELKSSILVKWADKKEIDGFIKVFSNDSVCVYKLCGE